MNQINLKTHYTAQELALLRFTGSPETRPGIAARAKKAPMDFTIKIWSGGAVLNIQ